MTAERWERVKAIFQDVVESEPAARAAILRERCGGDKDLLSEVESLLASDDNTPTSVMNYPVMEAAAIVAATPARSGGALVLKERYEVERELGRGGMSVVYLARDRQLLSKRVVVKVLLETSSQDAWVRQKFQQEMEALARIDHPGVVGVLDTGLTPEGKQFLVMQYIEGETLRSVIEAGPMELKRAGRLIRQIGQALAAAHEKGVWHRDLKPENIMLQRLGDEDHVRLIDFGIAGIQNSQFTGEKTKVAGSLNYMAPEQFAGHACAASDTYALAVVACELVTGKEPFPPGALSRLMAGDKTRPAPLRELRPELPASAEKSILKAMSFQPEARQASVGEFSEELYRALGGGETFRKTAVSGALEIAHVLFTDIVGYSLLPMDQQREYLGEFQQIVSESPQFQAANSAGDLISLPTGDGMALAFFGDPTAPAQCAVEVAAQLKSRPHLKLRMGVHSGPVYRVADVNANANVAGGGINMAQRVMDCGDAGHILVSRNVAEILDQLRDWRGSLQDLGVHEVKHGVKVHLFNLCKDGVGNPALPKKIGAAAPPSAPAPAPAIAPSAGAARRWKWLAAAAAILVLAVAGLIWRQKTPPVPTASQASPPLPERSLSYFITVQKFRDRKPYQQPFRLGRELVFEADYRIRLSLTGPAAGYIYVLNEGPTSTAEKPNLNNLFPSPAAYGGSARIEANQQLDILPDGHWIKFDAQDGTEKLWVVWSAQQIDELETLKSLMNDKDKGAVRDRDQALAILKDLGDYAKHVSIEPDTANRLTVLKGKGDVLAASIPLEHH
jgi:tRNA A-37 threonylcarbamoyl transferase component Bud32/class 3 adenylate cyclase